MCGITARVATDDVLEGLLSGLRALQYPGYDAAGVAVATGSGISVDRGTDGAADPVESLDPDATGRLGIGHTARDGRSTETPPFTDCEETVAVVCDGEVWNDESLREALRARNHRVGDDAAAAVVPHLIEERIAAGDAPDEALRATVRQVDGNYAVGMLVENREAVYAVRAGAPLYLGLSEDGYCLASDPRAFGDEVAAVAPLEDDDVAVATPTVHAVTDLDGNLVVRRPERASPLPA